ncbi:WhiB family transcriptional regulator [Nonomuraea sp. NPDC050790]|uniref:WhiB family transcriptional regulator n=1 Tax=Nonomuraea sp. NPDC050790 TaxID=3364371 RepID=UPI0037BD41EB
MSVKPSSPLSWTVLGACLDGDPDLFFPLSWEREPDAARRICQTCPVRRPCLAWAVETGEPDGMWGGATPAERRLLRAARERQAAA